DSPDVDQIPADVAIETDGTPRFEMAIRHQVRYDAPGCTRILVDDYGDYGQPPGYRNHRLAANAAYAAAERGWRWDITGRPGWWCPDCITWLYGDDYCEHVDCAPYYCPRKTSEIGNRPPQPRWLRGLFCAQTLTRLTAVGTYLAEIQELTQSGELVSA